MTQRNCVVETGRRVPRIQVVRDICLRRSRPTQGCRSDDDFNDDDNDDDDFRIVNIVIIVDLRYFTWVHYLIRSSQRRFLFGENDRMKLNVRRCLKLRKKLLNLYITIFFPS